MKKLFFMILSFSLVTNCMHSGRAQSNSGQKQISVAVYYFPNYHPDDARNVITKGPGWSEWELLKAAKPRFPGHDQPKVPLWGYTDEKDPGVMEQKIQTAVDYGIDCFIFDWYMYEDGPFLNRCLDEGFLNSKNVANIKFALMWANHDWLDIHPSTRGTDQKLLYPGKVSVEKFEAIGDLLITKYFTQPNYWLIDGRAYFSIYDIQKFIEGFGSIIAAKAAMERLNQKAVAAGLKGIHWNMVAWGRPILPVEKIPASYPDLLKNLNFTSATSYAWIHHANLPQRETDYNHVLEQYMQHWDKTKTEYPVPYFPNVSMGWDSSPRCDTNSEWGNYGYPFTNIVVNNTPDNFKKALQMTKDKLLADPNGARIMNIYCWNEWTEGSYLEPDARHQYGYLEAVKSVFK